MQIAIDIGNTNITCGLFSSEKKNYQLKTTFRISTPRIVTTDELTTTFKSILNQKGINMFEVKSGIFSSVVPELNHNFSKMMINHFNISILSVDHKMFSDMILNYDDSNAMGVDRLVNLKAASVLHGLPNIVIDFGTAITFDILSEKKEFLGGFIMPGIAISLEALAKKTSKLSMTALDYPKKVLGNSTKECMQNGIYYFSGIGIDGMINLVKKKYFLKKKISLVATGGLARYATHFSEEKIILESNLSLIGLKILLDNSGKLL